MLAILADRLGVSLVAVTSMTNLGFHRLMEERGVRVLTTDVGDRYVLDALRREGGILGGEQSGHVIVLDGHVSGDGLAAALLLARAVVETGRPLADLAVAMPRYPQAKRNVPVARQGAHGRAPDGDRPAERRARLERASSRAPVRDGTRRPGARRGGNLVEGRGALCTISTLVARELG